MGRAPLLPRWLDCIWNKRPLPDKSLFVLLGLLLFIMPVLSQDFGITWDEHFHYEYGRRVYNYYASGLTDKSATDYLSLHYYGGLFDLIAESAHRILPSFPRSDVKHAANSLFGWLAILFAALLARRVWGGWAGFFAALFLFLSPRFLAHCMNNPKDLPFATFYVLALYGMSLAEKRYPYFGRKALCITMAGIALALNIRVGGLLLLFYSGLYLLFLFLNDRENRSAGNALKLCGGLAILSLATIVLGTLFWPWALENPLLRPLQALQTFSRFTLTFGELYKGAYIDTGNIPWDYPLHWQLITVPLGVLCFGFLAVPLALIFRRKNPDINVLRLLGVVFAVLFPLAYVIATKPVLYNGPRHLLFIYAPFVVLAAGTPELLLRTRKRMITAAVCFLLIVGFYHPVRFQLRNHPNQVVYFNQLVGGVRGAFYRYEMDYWGNSFKQAIDWVNKVGELNGHPVTFSVNVSPKSALEYAKRYPFLTIVRPEAHPEFMIHLITGPELQTTLKNELLIHGVLVDGVPLCVVAFSPDHGSDRRPE